MGGYKSIPLCHGNYKTIDDHSICDTCNNKTSCRDLAIQRLRDKYNK